MRKRTKRQETLLSRQSCLLSLPDDLLIHIMKQLSAMNICFMGSVSSFFLQNNHIQETLLMLIKYKLPTFTSMTTTNKKELAHIERASKGIMVEACGSDIHHSSVIFHRNGDDTFVLGRHGENQNIRNPFVSRKHAIVQFPQNPHEFSWDNFIRMKVTGQNGIWLYTPNGFQKHYKMGNKLSLCIGDTIELGVGTNILYTIKYL